MNLSSNKAAGLYILIPFCVRKCPYCDFYSVTDLSLKAKFLGGLLREMQMASPETFAFDTLYIGGGTPSVYNAREIGQIVTSAFNHFDFLPNLEVTIESTPGPSQLSSCRDTGKPASTASISESNHFIRKILIFLGVFIRQKRRTGSSRTLAGPDLKISDLI